MLEKDSLNKIPESLVMDIWRHLISDRAELASEDGEPIKIVYPGRANNEQGADFQDAVVATSQGLRMGDIEVHVKSSSWQAHRHHRDPVYNRVILHVVMWDDADKSASLDSGEDIPTLALHKYIKCWPGKWLNSERSPAALDLPCRNITKLVPENVIAEFLDSAGDQRFMAKAAMFQTDMTKMEASQCLYRGIMGALGYSKNKPSFLDLANRLPIRFLEAIAHSQISDEECLARQQALLLGTAGLIPSPWPSEYPQNEPGDKWMNKLRRLWAAAHPQAKSMSPNAWHLSGVRPGNSPIRRLMAMSCLILRYRRSGILEGLMKAVEEAVDNESRHKLEKGLLVAIESYRPGGQGFSSGNGLSNQSLLGNERAADIAVNVLLPFAYAWSKASSQPKLGHKASALYHKHSRLSANTLEKHMKNQLGLSNDLINSARRQQGLIHIYKMLCTWGRCSCCRLSLLKYPP